VAPPPTVYIVTSDQARNGKTLLARCITDYLLLDRRDPFLIDTDTPEGSLRNYFPGRTQLVNFAKVMGQIKIFDTILASPGRDYVIDLSDKDAPDFFSEVRELGFIAEAQKLGFRFILLVIVDDSELSAKFARDLRRTAKVDLFVPVRNAFIGSAWPNDDAALTMPALEHATATAIANRRFSFRAFVLGDTQNLPEQEVRNLNRFVYEVMQGLNNLEPEISIKGLRG
jgi:1,2-phenylacetyl-CoA epoxidase PaaB subunit